MDASTMGMTEDRGTAPGLQSGQGLPLARLSLTAVAVVTLACAPAGVAPPTPHASGTSAGPSFAPSPATCRDLPSALPTVSPAASPTIANDGRLLLPGNDPWVIRSVSDESAQTIDIAFRGESDEAVDAYLVLPHGCPRGEIVFAHPHEPGDRRFFLDEARALASDGYASVLPNSPFRRRPFPPLVTWTAEDGVLHARAIDELERAIGVLDTFTGAHLPVAAVGQAYGAGSALHLGARIPRVRAVVAISPLASRTAFWESADPTAVSARRTVSEEQFEAFLASIAPFDAVDAFPAARDTPLLLQGVQQDRAEIEVLAELSASDEMRTFPATGTAAEADRRAFITSVLGSE